MVMFKCKTDPREYAKEWFIELPPGLPDRFYPNDEHDMFKTDKYVVCFKHETPEDIRQRVIADYPAFYAEYKKRTIGI